MTKQKKTPRWHRRDVFQAAGATVGAAALAPIVAAAAAPSEISDAITQQPTPEPGAEQNTSDIFVQTLIDWGATHVFGVVGDGINSLLKHCVDAKTGFGMSPCATKRQQPLWRAGSPNIPGVWVYA